MHTELWNNKAVKTLLMIALFASPGLTPFAQSAKQAMPNQTRNLSASDIALVQSSKAAIINTGFSVSYFEAHFKVERVVNTAGDRRVIWKFNVGEYVAILNDSVGYYTDDKGQRINIHAIGNMLSKAHDIKSTIPKKRAEQLMSQCLGKYTAGAVVFEAFGAPPRASLLYIASSVPTPRKENRKEEREKSEGKREKERKEKSGGRKSQTDAVNEEDEEDAPLIYTGFLDLETGACTKGVAQVDHPRPVR